MKFICSKEKFLESINIVSRAVSTKAINPINETILIKTYENGLKLTANNMELAIESGLIESEIQESGSVCIEAKILSDIVRHLPEDDLLMDVNENNVIVIKSGKAQFKILGLAGEIFPNIPEVEKNNKYEMSSSKLKDMIRQTIFAVSQDESKITLTGELLDIKNDSMNIVAVDGFRVSLRETEITTDNNDISIIIPGKTMAEIGRILPQGEDEKVSIYITDLNVLFEINDCIVVSRLIQGDFMNYEQVFTDNYTTRIVLDRVNFVSCLERSSIISDVKKNPVKLTIENETLIATSQNELGTTYEEIFADIDGESLEIAFNPKYLIDALKAIDEEKIVIEFTTSLSPCVIKSVEKSNYKYLVLPLRLKN